MYKRLLVFTIFILPFLFSTRPIVAGNMVEKNTSFQQIEAKKLDKKAQILAAYLAKYDSPLQYHAQDFIDAAQRFGLDWKMLPAIAGVESTFGKVTPGGYNGWGWGVYGNKALYFASWTDGIFSVAKGLRENYIDRGLTDPYSINRAYAASPYWGWKVSYFMNDLERFAQIYEASQQVANVNIPAIKIAATSGKLVLR